MEVQNSSLKTSGKDEIFPQPMSLVGSSDLLTAVAQTLTLRTLRNHYRESRRVPICLPRSSRHYSLRLLADRDGRAEFTYMYGYLSRWIAHTETGLPIPLLTEIDVEQVHC